MKSRSGLFMLLVVIVLLLAACGGGAPAVQSPEVYVEPAAATEAPGMQAPSYDDTLEKEAEGIPQDQAVAEAPFAPMPTAAAYEISNPSGDLTVVERSNRMIIKNADIRLMVKETDVAIDRATQIIGDAGGYIISSRVWYQDYYGNSLKYATVTIGIPVEEFERALVKLRDLSIRVLDEVASGEDVTDQYVDLESQLTNLEATRARIQEFLQDAKTVDEALRINQELANIEAQIEQIKGRMNYLNDRSAFSTITINFEPEFPALTPTPTPTAHPTATPIPWKPGETFQQATNTVTVAYQGIVDFLIWIGVVIVPILLPFALILWAIWKLVNRKPVKVMSQKADGD